MFIRLHALWHKGYQRESLRKLTFLYYLFSDTIELQIQIRKEYQTCRHIKILAISKKVQKL